jgi:D-amino-acid dehydrogenase
MKRIVVIGGGLIGLSSALECARRGHEVTVIEAAPERRGASFGNAGFVCPSHFIPLAAPGMVALGLKWMWNPESPFYIKPRLSWDLAMWVLRFWRASTRERVERVAPLLRDLHLASRGAFLRLAGEGEEFGLVTKGLLVLCQTQEGLGEEADTAAMARRLGVAADVLDARQTAALDPGVTMDIVGAAYFPGDCHLRPERFVAALERRVRASGGRLMFGPRVIGWRKSGARLDAVQTTEGEVAGDEFILAGGAWSSGLARELGLRLPMQAGKGYSLTLPNPVQMPQICSILKEARAAVTPMDGALRFGGTMEIAGFNEDINPRRIAGILKAVTRYFPKFRREDFDDIQPWCGLRPCSPDGLPYLGRTGAASNLIVATGHAMMGLSLAPVTGELAAQLVEGEPPRFDLRLLAPDRYA